MTPAIGWVSSLILLATLINQNVKQWRSSSSQGVSKWLFVGQTVASLGFCIYSVLVRDWVFVVTNAALLINAIIGASVAWYRRSQQGAQPVLSEFGPVAANSPQSSA